MLTYHIITYGCQMNVHESEKIAGMLTAIGYTETEDLNAADVIVFNTCCIRDTAEKRAYGNIGALKSLKKTRPELIIAVLGCMTQQTGGAEALLKKFPFVDIVLGTHNIDELPVLLQEKRSKRHIISINTDTSPEINENIPIYRTSGTNAWINIMYGCNNFCTYCIVPYTEFDVGNAETIPINGIFAFDAIDEGDFYLRNLEITSENREISITFDKTDGIEYAVYVDGKKKLPINGSYSFHCNSNRFAKVEILCKHRNKTVYRKSKLIIPF